MPKYRVTWTDCMGVCSLYDKVEIFTAINKYHAWRKFIRKYGKDGPKCGYQTNFSWDVMKDDIFKINKKEK